MTASPKLLIIDDDTLIHNLIESALEGGKYQIFNAYNGKEGAELYRKHTPALVLLDLDMPIMNGAQFLQDLDFKTNKECPVIVISGLASGKEQDLCLELGAEMFMGKPFQIMALKKTIDYYLDRRPLSP